MIVRTRRGLAKEGGREGGRKGGRDIERKRASMLSCYYVLTVHWEGGREREGLGREAGRREGYREKESHSSCHVILHAMTGTLIWIF